MKNDILLFATKKKASRIFELVSLAKIIASSNNSNSMFLSFFGNFDWFVGKIK